MVLIIVNSHFLLSGALLLFMAVFLYHSHTVSVISLCALALLHPCNISKLALQHLPCPLSQSQLGVLREGASAAPCLFAHLSHFLPIEAILPNCGERVQSVLWQPN